MRLLNLIKQAFKDALQSENLLENPVGPGTLNTGADALTWPSSGVPDISAAKDQAAATPKPTPISEQPLIAGARESNNAAAPAQFQPVLTTSPDPKGVERRRQMAAMSSNMDETKRLRDAGHYQEIANRSFAESKARRAAKNKPAAPAPMTGEAQKTPAIQPPPAAAPAAPAVTEDVEITKRPTTPSYSNETLARIEKQRENERLYQENRRKSDAASPSQTIRDMHKPRPRAGDFGPQQDSLSKIVHNPEVLRADMLRQNPQYAPKDTRQQRGFGDFLSRSVSNAAKAVGGAVGKFVGSVPHPQANVRKGETPQPPLTQAQSRYGVLNLLNKLNPFDLGRPPSESRTGGAKTGSDNSFAQFFVKDAIGKVQQENESTDDKKGLGLISGLLSAGAGGSIGLAPHVYRAVSPQQTSTMSDKEASGSLIKDAIGKARGRMELPDTYDGAFGIVAELKKLAAEE